MGTADGFGKEIRHIQYYQLTRKSQLLFADSGTIGDNDGVNAFTCFHVFQAVVAKETWYIQLVVFSWALCNNTYHA